MLRQPLATALLALLPAATWANDPAWPDLSKPAASIVGGGQHDAAVIVGIEDYTYVPGVDGAQDNAEEWYDYLAKTRLVPPENIVLLTGNDATREQILGAAKKAAGYASEDGALWFVFVGHGAASADGKDGLLVGVDAQQKPESLQSRSVRRQELLAALATSPAKSIHVVLDACFSGRGADGAPIVRGLQPLTPLKLSGIDDQRIDVLTAGGHDQFAGPLPGSDVPAFSYLILGGLRGWAAEPDGTITSGDLWRYSSKVLQATLHGREQTPELMGSRDNVIALSAGEQPPDLVQLAKDSSRIGSQVIKTRKARADNSLKVWAGGGISQIVGISKATRIGWHSQLTIADIRPEFDVAIDGGGGYRRDDLIPGNTPGVPGDNESVHSDFIRVKSDYRFGLPPKQDYLIFPDWIVVGAGAGLFSVTEQIATTYNLGGSSYYTSTGKKNRLLILPSFELGPAWRLAKRFEFRVMGQYVVPVGPRIGIAGFQYGGLGFTADLSYRFK